MSKLHEYFQYFFDHTVNLNDHRIETLNDRVATITNFLSEDTVFGELFVDVIPQGSYAHRTIIKPVGNREYDADILLALKEHPTWTPAEYTLELRRAFNSSSRYAGMAHMRSRCVYIDYANEFHVDVVPYVVDRRAITNNKGGWNGEGCWQTSLPEEFTSWLEGKYRITGGQLPAVMRLLKYLRDYKATFSVKSVILMILAGNVVSESKTWADEGYYCDVPTAFVHVLEDLAAWLRSNPGLPPILDPAGSGTDFSERWDAAGYANFSACIQQYAAKAREAIDADDPAASLAQWQGIFGPGFKKASATRSLEAAASAPSRAPQVAALEQFIDRDLRIPKRITRDVRLVGRVRGSGVRKPYDLPKRGDLVGKHRTIDFRLEDLAVERPFDVYWKVRNFGDEVADASEMRGQILKGGETHFESTKWRGSHFVEVYVVKDGVCIASDRQKVIVTNRL